MDKAPLDWKKICRNALRLDGGFFQLMILLAIQLISMYEFSFIYLENSLQEKYFQKNLWNYSLSINKTANKYLIPSRKSYVST